MAQVVTCTTASVIAAGDSAPPITLTVGVEAAALPSVSNTARVGGGGDAGCPVPPATTPPPEARCSAIDTADVVDSSVTIAKTSVPASPMLRRFSSGCSSVSSEPIASWTSQRNVSNS